MKKLPVLLVLALLSAISFAEPELKGNPSELRQFLHPEAKTVTLYGEAEEKAYSDTAIISLVVTTEAKLLSDSIAANAELRQTIARQLSSAGIKAENINSSKFSTSPQYGWFGKKPDSYKVVNRMAVKITSEAHLQAIAAVADAKPEIELSDISFEHSEEDAFKDKVKQKALAKVMEQKKFYESNLGVKLTPIGFRDSSVGQNPTRGAQILEEVVVTGIRGASKSYEAYDGEQSRAPSFDEVEYSGRISVEFRIE